MIEPQGLTGIDVWIGTGLFIIVLAVFCWFALWVVITIGEGLNIFFEELIRKINK